MELVVLLSLVLGVVSGIVAQSKGRSFVGYLVLGTLIPIVGLILAIALPAKHQVLEERELDTGGRKKCPYCAELIRSEARVCRFCGRELSGISSGGVVLRDPWAAADAPRARVVRRLPVPGERMQLKLGTAIREQRSPTAPMVAWAAQDSVVTVVKGDTEWAWVQADDGAEGWMAL